MTKPRNQCDVNTCFMCAHCWPDWRPPIEPNKKNIPIKKGQQIFSEGDIVKGIYFVYDGKIKVHRRWDEEKELILRFAQKGDILGHLGLGGDDIYPVSATAIEPSIVCFADLQFFETTLRVNNTFTIKLMQFFANELQASEKRMHNLVNSSVKVRVAQAILTLKKQFGVNESGYINIEPAKQDLASFSGAAYESLFRTLNDLVDTRIIELSGKKIMVKNEVALLQIIKENA